MDSLPAIVKYVRFERAGVERYGIWEGDLVKELYGSPLSGVRETGREFLRSDTRLLVPCPPSEVLAVGLNYASHREHVEGSEGVILNASGRPVPSHYPGVFAKFPTSLIADGDSIVLPDDAANVHFEGELVVNDQLHGLWTRLYEGAHIIEHGSLLNSSKTSLDE